MENIQNPALPSIIKESSEKADLLERIQPERAVEVLKYLAMGYTFDNERGEWVKNKFTEKYALNEFGANYLAMLLYPCCSQNAVLSELSEGDIKRMALGISKAFLRMAITYPQEMNITSTSQLDALARVVKYLAELTLKQAKNGGLKDLLKSTVVENWQNIQHIKEKPSDEKKPFLRRLIPF